MEAKNLFIDALPKIEGLENESTAKSQLGVFSDELRSGVLDQKIGDPGIIANLTKSLNVSQPADTSKVKPFIETMGGETKFPIPSRVAEGSDLIKERIDQLREMRIGDYPPDVALGIPSYEKEQAYEGIRPYALKYGPKAAKEFFEAQGIDTEPYLKGMAPILYMKQGGRIQLANGGRLSFAEGPEDPKKRATLKKIGIGGGLTAAVGTGLINLLDLFKGGAKTGVMATKAAQSEAEKLFFDLVNAVKNKGILKKLDQMTDYSRGGAYYEYKGVKVLEDGENIELQFTTDKGAPAMVEYRKPGYDVDPEAGTTQKIPGEFTNEGQEVARYGKDGDVDIDFENEIIDTFEETKKIIDD